MSSKVNFASALIATLFIPPALGFAETRPIHRGAWPIYDWLNHQPTEDELRAFHERDVSRSQAREVDRLYDQLMIMSKRNVEQHPALP